MVKRVRIRVVNFEKGEITEAWCEVGREKGLVTISNHGKPIAEVEIMEIECNE